MMIRISTLLLTSFLLAACGNDSGIATKQDPLEGYERYKNAVPSHQVDEKINYEPTQAVRLIQSHKIEVKNDLNFIEGEVGKALIEVQILTAFADQVDYELRLDGMMKELGATMTKKSKSQYEINWKPSSQILANNEANKKIPGELRLVVKKTPNTEIARLFDLNHKKLKIEAVVNQNAAVPQFKGAVRVAQNGQRLSLGQQTNFTFTIQAKNIQNKEDIEILINPKAMQLGGGVLHASAKYGVVDGATLVNSSLKDNGDFLATYNVKFDSVIFWEQIQQEIPKNANARREFRNGEYSVAEAALVIVAKNTVLNQEIDKEFFIYIDLGFKPSAVQLSSETDKLEVQTRQNRNRTKTERFTVKSENSQGRIQLIEASINEVKLEQNESKPTELELKNENLEVELSCALVSINKVEEECVTGQCLRQCSLKVKSECAPEDKTINLQMKFLNTMGDQALESQITRTIQILKSEKQCEGAQS